MFPFAYIVICAFSVMLLAGCKSCNSDPNQNQTGEGKGGKYGGETHVAPYSDSFPLLVWRKPSTSKGDFKKWIDNRHPDRIDYCKDCDSNLAALGGPGPLTYIMGLTVNSPSPGTGGKPSGEDDSVYYSANFKIKIPFTPVKNFEKTAKYNFGETAFSDSAVTVAVFDTGLDSGLYKNGSRWFATITNTCIPGGEHGWNFHDSSKKTFDDHPHKHGSIVTSLIIQQAALFKKNDVRILPLKIHGGDGTSSLYDVLCGISYAQKAGVKIVNASFGYYSYGNESSTLLFKNYIDYYLTKNNILMICAAGNEDTEADKAVASADKRNLEVNPFYPACFSNELYNVITVTTVSRQLKNASPNQNFSPKFVDVGVNRDLDNTATANYAFANPLKVVTDSVVGSSFATPVVTGIIASNFNSIFPSGINQAAIQNSFKGAGFPKATVVGALNIKVKKGKMVHR